MIFFNALSFRGVVITCWLLFVVIAPGQGDAVAAENNDASSEALMLKDFPGASIESETHTHAENYIVALGNYRKTQGLWQVEQLRLSGELTRKTYRLPDNHSARAGYLFFVSQLEQYPLRELYACQSRDCEASSRWASTHFKVLQLHGLDQYQYYGAYEVMPPDSPSVYVTVYAVLRGNKRVYVQLEILQSEEHDSL